MDNEEINRLQLELSETLEKSAEISQIRLDQNRGIIDAKIKNIIEVYSNDIRNTGIISGTVAPFSLTLLGVQQLNSNSLVLIVGFGILLLNIVLSQYWIRKYLSGHNTNLVRGIFHGLIAEADLEETKNKNLDLNKRVSKNFDYLKSVSEAEKFLGNSNYNTEILKVWSGLRKNYKITNILFSIGTLCIMLSVVVNPVYEYAQPYISHFLDILRW